MAAKYVAQVNRETLVCVQLEEGIDVFFVGPSDLVQSMGFPGRSDTPVVQQMIRATRDAIADYLKRGCRYVYTRVPRLLAAGTAAFRASTDLTDKTD